ncbi:MAG: PD40 domain-containing protein [Armatimonadetes bacterium]|nr:PD40 domain-containing protein [Armatimonadota bacterium]
MTIAACGGGGGATSGTAAKIVYTRYDGTGEDIFTMNPDGTDRFRLTYTGSCERPAWSHDGSKVVYVDTGTSPTRIAIINSDGTNNHYFDLGTAFGFYPSVSPNGAKIAFDSDFANPGGSIDDIYVMNVDGSNVLRLTTTGDNDHPRWSPDGTKILFISSRDGSEDLYVMNADGTNQTSLGTTAGNEFYAQWSPDGSKIVYTLNGGIYTANANGSGVTHVVDGNFPDFSYDGTKIIYCVGPNYNIYTVNLDGSGAARVSTDTESELDPSWAR